MSDDKKDPKGKAKGGIARAKSLTKEQRSDIAKKQRQQDGKTSR